MRTARAGSPATLMNSTMSSGLAPASTRLNAMSASPSSVTANGGAELHGGRAQREQLADPLVRVDAAGRDQRDRVRRDALGAEERVHVGQHALEIEARIGEILDLRRAEVAAGVARMLDDDRVGQAALARPFLDDELDAARVGQDRNQRDVGIIGGEVGQVERQPGAHHDRVGAARAGLAHARRRSR